jgi:hypothetical protein
VAWNDVEQTASGLTICRNSGPTTKAVYRCCAKIRREWQVLWLCQQCGLQASESPNADPLQPFPIAHGNPNKNERYLATSSGCLAVESSCCQCVKLGTRLTALETGEMSGKQPNSLFPKDSCFLLGLVLFSKMSMVWSDMISAVYKVRRAVEC